MFEILGYISAVLIGLLLGITGGGGSILTVPVLVYVLNYNPVIATCYSLFIVGTTSMFGTILNFKKRLVDPKTALLFAIPSVIGVYFTRKFIIPALPDILLDFDSFQLRKETFLMLLFAVIIFISSYSMLRTKKHDKKPKTKNVYIIILKLLSVGILIGLIGAGGGFLIIPALIELARLTIKKAIGTSLLIITINSVIGFIGDVQNPELIIDWMFLIPFCFLSVTGIFIGLYIQNLINEKQLKKIFGLFLLSISFLILYKELIS